MQQKINYLIVGIIGFLLVILGVYYYQIQPKADIIPNETSPKLDLGENKKEMPGEVVSELSPAEIKAKFNTIMDNARKALNNKDYLQAITYYKQALTYENTDTPYSGLFVVYGAQGDWVNAQKALDSAIKINPLFVDYWVSKLEVLNEKTSVTYEDLKNVYNEALPKVDPARKIDLVTFFAKIAEDNEQIYDAISLWTYAKNLYSENVLIYQAEIDRLQEKM